MPTLATSHPSAAPALRARVAQRAKRALAGPLGVLASRALRTSRRRLGVVIVYHRVGDPAGDPATELVPAMGTALFRAQLRLLRSEFDVVSAGNLAQAVAARERFGRFPVAVTFDDEWPGHADVALPLLAEAGVPATFFVGGASLEGPFDFWFDRLQDAFDTGLQGPPEAIHAEAARVDALPRAERDALVRSLAERMGPQPADRSLRADAVRRLVAAGHEIGFHTRRHDALTTLEADELEAALHDGRAELEAVTGAPLRAIAYPSGRANGDVVARAEAAGFERGYSTMPSPIGAASPPLWLGRVYPSPESASTLRFVLARALLASARAADYPPGD